MPVTIQDIADHLKISTATVSRSLRNDPLIHPETRARVSHAAAAVGYQGRSRRGRSLQDSATDGAATEKKQRPVIAVVCASDLMGTRRHHNIVRLLQGITAECDALRAINSLHVLQQPGVDGATGLPDGVRDYAYDAAIVIGPLAEPHVAWMSARCPVVTISRRYDGCHADAVVQDNMVAFSSLVKHLVQLGHPRLRRRPPCGYVRA
jgi:DNA-binding LacI/PurR family transcriptional regulator